MKIAVVTGTRAEFGLLAPLMHKIEASQLLDLITMVTGTHLLPDFGYTVEDIKSEGFAVDATIPEIASARDGADVARQVGSGILGFTDALVSLEPDALVLLGDRYELLSAATAAFFLEVPIVHLHGGEVTEGAFDDTIRHAISKFASVHAVAAPEYRDRLIRAGEQPASVHVVGGFGVDLVATTNRFTRSELEAELGIAIGEQLLLVTYHPVTAAPHETQQEIDALVAALGKFPDATVVFTLPNADPEHDIISAAISKAVSKNDAWHSFPSFGSRKYLSLMALSAVVVGNSSSGLLEAPSLGIPSVNIGPRQDGRLKAASVLSSPAEASAIEHHLRHAMSQDFMNHLSAPETPYGGEGAVERVMRLLESTAFDNLGHKKYFDVTG